jgi:hypothetical protein
MSLVGECKLLWLHTAGSGVSMNYIRGRKQRRNFDVRELITVMKTPVNFVLLVRFCSLGQPVPFLLFYAKQRRKLSSPDR